MRTKSSNTKRGFRGAHSTGGGFKPQRRNPYRGDHIDQAKYIFKAVANSTSHNAVYDSQLTFADFPLQPRLLANIAARAYTHPTKIQAQALAPILANKDIIGLSATGSGKTAAFLIPIVNALLLDPHKRCLVVAPSRELVNQIQDEFYGFARNTGVTDVLIMGGSSYSTQIRLLKRNPQVVIATPGRLIDLYNQRYLELDSFDIIVLDEVDQMLDMGFIRDIQLIIAKLKPVRQSLFFSATMSPKIRQIAATLAQNAVTIELTDQTAINTVEQNIVKVNAALGKLGTLHELLINTACQKVLVFSRTKHGADDIAAALSSKGHKVDSLHGNKSVGQRLKILAMFKRSQINILVATDVASRGIDVPDISHVINYDEPATYADYIHRIGRTGRIGKTGYALTFV
jgi:superfamily II DNA/RNA helicase